MPDPIFAHPRLAAVYDAFDSDRSDLDAYLAIVDELGAGSVLDVGCGTGTFALRLAARGLDVVGVDPAAASLAVARGKPGAERVHEALRPGGRVDAVLPQTSTRSSAPWPGTSSPSWTSVARRAGRGRAGRWSSSHVDEFSTHRPS